MKKRINIAAFVLFLIGFIGGLVYYGLTLIGDMAILGSPETLANLAKQYEVTKEVMSQVVVTELITAVISLIICIIFLIFACRNKSKPMGNGYPIAVLACASISIIYTIILMGFVIFSIIIWILILIAAILQTVHKEKTAPVPFLYNVNGADPYRQSPYIDPYAPQQGPYNPYATNPYGQPQNPYAEPFAPSRQDPYAPNPYMDPNAQQRPNDPETQNNDKPQNPFEPPK